MRWSIRKLAEVSGQSKSTVHTILTAGKLKPHKTKYWCGKSPDPEFAEKRAAIIGLYISPPEIALVLCVDEKSQIQALDRTQPLLPMRPDDPARLKHFTFEIVSNFKGDAPSPCEKSVVFSLAWRGRLGLLAAGHLNIFNVQMP